MPNTKAAQKAVRTSARKRIINERAKKKMKEAIKEIDKLIDTENLKEAKEKMSQTMKAIDKAAKKGVIKKNNAARKKSRLAKAINKKESSAK